MTANKKLNQAILKKDDEYYTQLKDIEKELVQYRHHFKDKVVFCNCDDYRHSNFVKYFAQHFKALGLKKLLAMTFCADGNTVLVAITGQIDELDSIVNHSSPYLEITPVHHNGDFRNPESLAIVQLADVIVTNPPFSLFREFVDMLIAQNKQFLIIGNCNAISYKNCFSYIANNQLWLGFHCVRWFFRPTGELKEAARSFWFTNLSNTKRDSQLPLFKTYCADEFASYDNYLAIEVAKTKDIPKDYQGVMGVPVTFLEKYNPKQFEIVGMDFYVKDGLLNELINPAWSGKLDRAYLNGKRLYSRVLIRHKRG